MEWFQSESVITEEEEKMRGACSGVIIYIFKLCSD